MHAIKVICILILFVSLQVNAQTDKSIKNALDDLPGIDILNVLIAVEQIKERGIDFEINYLQSEEIALQSVINGISDIGIGTLYGLVDKTKASIRMFYQLNKLRFHPVVNAQYYKSWKELDNIVMYSHVEGSGTEALLNMIAKK